MKALIVYESMFGNCRLIAEAIAAGIVAAGGAAEPVEVGQAPTATQPDLDLLIVGGPNHFMALSTPQSRIDAGHLVDHPVISADRGLREWLGELQPNEAETKMAIFDCRLNHPDYINNHEDASQEIKLLLYDAGYEDAVDPLHILVQEKPGPLIDGELARARAWGAVLPGS